MQSWVVIASIWKLGSNIHSVWIFWYNSPALFKQMEIIGDFQRSELMGGGLQRESKDPLRVTDFNR